MPNPLFLFAAQIVAIMSVLLLAAGYLKIDPRASSARVFGIMAVFIVFYLLRGMTTPNVDPDLGIDLSSIYLPLTLGTNAICGLFMIYCFLIFQEQQRFPVTLAAAFALQVSVRFILTLLELSEGVSTSRGLILLSSSTDVLELTFVGFAIYWTLKGWRTDLVNDRRAMRWFTIGVQGVLIFVIVVMEDFLMLRGLVNAATGQAIIVYSIAFLGLAMLLTAMRFDLVSLSYVIRRVAELTEEPEKEGARPFDIESFNAAFKDGLMYREAGLTISMLAKKLNMPEYRLRSFVHKQLGFRNFNAMLHEYRVEDASRALSDQNNQNLPVLTIALSVGYQSITPFNNVFRQIKGVTPSEYRKQHAS